MCPPGFLEVGEGGSALSVAGGGETNTTYLRSTMQQGSPKRRSGSTKKKLSGGHPQTDE